MNLSAHLDVGVTNAALWGTLPVRHEYVFRVIGNDYRGLAVRLSVEVTKCPLVASKTGARMELETGAGNNYDRVNSLGRYNNYDRVNSLGR